MPVRAVTLSQGLPVSSAIQIAGLAPEQLQTAYHARLTLIYMKIGATPLVHKATCQV